MENNRHSPCVVAVAKIEYDTVIFYLHPRENWHRRFPRAIGLQRLMASHDLRNALHTYFAGG